MPSGWTRGTLWRQGSAIELDASLSLGLLNWESPKESIVLVISHDCDIVEDDLANEPTVEVIVGRYIAEADPNLTHSKSPNRLHLEVLKNGMPAFIELLATQKHSVLKDGLAAYVPDGTFSISARNRETLQAWLAARYRRASFPDALNKHLRLLRDTLKNIGKDSPSAIANFFIYFEPDAELTDDSEPYELWIVVVYCHEDVNGEKVAGAAVERINKRIESKFKSSTGWRGIELRGCDAVSDEEFSYYNAMTFRNYPLEYLSLRTTEEEADL